MTMRYTHLSLDYERQAVAQLEEFGSGVTPFSQRQIRSRKTRPRKLLKKIARKWRNWQTRWI